MISLGHFHSWKQLVEIKRMINLGLANKIFTREMVSILDGLINRCSLNLRTQKSGNVLCKVRILT